MKTFYLTTPIYYVNDVPHIGHAYTTIAADVLARWKRLCGQPVFFLTGTDEHGAKIDKAAESAQETPQAFVNRITAEYKKTWSILNITYDDFIQTSEPRHEKMVQAVFERLKSTGDIYKGFYEDWYCLHDETYFTESELVEKKCPSCGRDVQKLKEESYFFRLSKYELPLLEYYASHPDFLAPRFRASEITNFVKSGLKDLSVSRTKVKWGIPVPSDPGHVAYVWFDALLNYISALGYDPNEKSATNELFKNCWPADVQFVGKEIFRFHTVIWPAMLMALGIPLPQKVFAHGWWTVEGTKMSKSLGNVVDPQKMVLEYGADAFRYFLLREVSFGSDGDFSEAALRNRFNTEMANNIGNLLQRVNTLLLKNFEGIIPREQPEGTLLPELPKLMETINRCYTNLAFDGVLTAIYELVTRTNKYVDDKQPWNLANDKAALAVVLSECLAILKILAILLHPFMPNKMQEVWQRLGEKEELSQQSAKWIAAFSSGQPPSFVKGQTVIKGDPLFLRKGQKTK